MIHRIEIDFALPVELTDKEMSALHGLVDHICRRECPEGWAFWAAGAGSKPNFSQADSRFLGKRVDPKAPPKGEPTWDDTVYSIDCAARQLYPHEIEQRQERARRAAERNSRGDLRFARWLYRRGWKRASRLVRSVNLWASQ